MQPVPNYSVVEFLDWLKHNQRTVDIQSKELEQLAKIYLEDIDYHRHPFDLLFILKIFQIYPYMRSRDIKFEMEHFLQCESCIESFFERQRNIIESYSTCIHSKPTQKGSQKSKICHSQFLILSFNS